MEKNIFLEKLFLQYDPAQIAAALIRAESDNPHDRNVYRKGIKSTLELFTDNYDFIETILNEFDKIYDYE